MSLRWPIRSTPSESWRLSIFVYLTSLLHLKNSPSVCQVGETSPGKLERSSLDISLKSSWNCPPPKRFIFVFAWRMARNNFIYLGKRDNVNVTYREKYPWYFSCLFCHQFQKIGGPVVGKGMQRNLKQIHWRVSHPEAWAPAERNPSYECIWIHTCILPAERNP